MSDTLAYVGDLTDDLLYGALSPDGSTLYAFELNRDFHIRSYAFPALTGGSVVVSNVLGPMACDGDGTLYWTDNSLNEAMTLANTQIWKDPGSPTLVWESAFVSPTPKVNMCWSPYDDLLYAVIDDLLYSIDSGTATLLFTPSVGGAALLEGPVPTLDGGIWWSSDASNWVVRYDIPTASAAENATGSTSYQEKLIPRPDGTCWGYQSGGATAWTVATDLTKTSNPAIQGTVGGVRGTAYTPDLGLVVFGNRGTNGVWQVGEVVAPVGRFTIGSVGFHASL